MGPILRTFWIRVLDSVWGIYSGLRSLYCFLVPTFQDKRKGRKWNLDDSLKQMIIDGVCKRYVEETSNNRIFGIAAGIPPSWEEMETRLWVWHRCHVFYTCFMVQMLYFRSIKLIHYFPWTSAVHYEFLGKIMLTVLTVLLLPYSGWHSWFACYWEIS